MWLVKMKFQIYCENCRSLYTAKSKTDMAAWIQTHFSDRLCSVHLLKIVKAIDI